MVERDEQHPVVLVERPLCGARKTKENTHTRGGFHVDFVRHRSVSRAPLRTPCTRLSSSCAAHGRAAAPHLRAIPVVHIVVDDGDALQAPVGQRVRGCDGDVVEDAEPHAPVWLSVVPGRPVVLLCVCAHGNGCGSVWRCCEEQGAPGRVCCVWPAHLARAVRKCNRHAHGTHTARTESTQQAGRAAPGASASAPTHRSSA